MKFEILHRHTGNVLFTAKLSAACEKKPRSVQLGAAVKLAIKANANLAGANLVDADLARAYLADANLADAYLADANLADANLVDADLAGASLAGANLANAYLAGANLVDADLADAYLADANLVHANLARADLLRTDLRRADLANADLRDADLAGANLAGAKHLHFQLPDGSLIGWKKAGSCLVKLRIPERARRTTTPVGRKCRAEMAEVVWIDGGGPVTTRGGCEYVEGQEVWPDRYCDDWRIECSHGIHFFLTREEAVAW